MSKGRHRKPARTVLLAKTSIPLATAGTLAIIHPAAAQGQVTADHPQVHLMATVPVTVAAETSYTVKPGDTLWQIAASRCHDPSDWSGIYWSNRDKISDPDVIQAGWELKLDCFIKSLPSLAPAPVQAAEDPATQPQPQEVVSGDSSFQQCVIARESGGNPDAWNPTGHWGLYQFSEQTWVAYGGSPSDFGTAGAAEQDQVFDNAMATPGGADNWSPYDGC